MSKLQNHLIAALAAILVNTFSTPIAHADVVEIPIQVNQLSHSTGQGLSNAVDASVNSRWTTNQKQTPGQFFQIDLLQPIMLSRIVMQTSNGSASVNDYPRGYDVLLSNDGTTWNTHITGGVGNQGGQTTIPMKGKVARYVRIVQTGSDSFYWWSIHNIDVFGENSNGNNDSATSYQTGLWYAEVPGNLNTKTPNPKTEIVNILSNFTENEIKASTTEIFTGQIYDADGIISFTENIDDKAYIKINGQVVLNDDRWNVRTSTGTLFAKPGWNDIEIRISNGGGLSGPQEGIGIGFDPKGGTDWQRLIDTRLFRVSTESTTDSGGESQNLTDFYLIDADSNTVFAQLTEGQQFDLASLPASYAFSYNPAVNADGTVAIALTGAVTATRNEGVKPYSLFGDSNGNYNGNPSDKALVVGSYQITANGQSVNFVIGSDDNNDGDTGGGDTGEKINLQTNQLSHSAGQGLSNAIDESINSRWTSNQAQAPGQYFQIDLFQPTVLTEIVMQTSNGSASVNDYPRGFDVLLSNDGITWNAHLTGGVGSQSGQINIPLNRKSARFVRILQTGSSSFWWSIHNIDVFAIGYVNDNNDGGGNGDLAGLHPDIVKVVDIPLSEIRTIPGGLGWADSYSVGDQCYCATTYDHDIANIIVATVNGPEKVIDICNSIGPGPGREGRPLYNDVQCGNGPANNAGDEDWCPGRVDLGTKEGCRQVGPTWKVPKR